MPNFWWRIEQDVKKDATERGILFLMGWRGLAAVEEAFYEGSGALGVVLDIVAQGAVVVAS